VANNKKANDNTRKYLISFFLKLNKAKIAKNNGKTPILGVPSPYCVVHKLLVAGLPKKSGLKRARIFLKGIVSLLNTSLEKALFRGEFRYNSMLGIVCIAVINKVDISHINANIRALDRTSFFNENNLKIQYDKAMRNMNIAVCIWPENIHEDEEKISKNKYLNLKLDNRFCIEYNISGSHKME
jgi:hypothetical protein